MAVNHIQRKRVTVPLAIVIALAITPALSGCFANPIEQLVEGATGGNVDLGGGSLPEGFPTDVPVIDGEIVFGMSLGNVTDGQAWNVTVKVADASAIDTIKSELSGAGFTENAAMAGGAEAGSAVYENDAYGILVVVTDDGENGFVANYTVTAKTQ